MKPAAKIYLRSFGLSMALYMVAVFGVNSFLIMETLPQWQSALLALIPMVPVLFAVRAVLVFSRSWDELQKQQAMEGFLIAFILVGVGTFSYGFLEGVGFPALQTIWIFPMLIAAQGIGRFYVMWKYK